MKRCVSLYEEMMRTERCTWQTPCFSMRYIATLVPKEIVEQKQGVGGRMTLNGEMGSLTEAGTSAFNGHGIVKGRPKGFRPGGRPMGPRERVFPRARSSVLDSRTVGMKEAESVQLFTGVAPATFTPRRLLSAETHGMRRNPEEPEGVAGQKWT